MPSYLANRQQLSASAGDDEQALGYVPLSRVTTRYGGV
jgi:hypothetical protein